MADRDEKVVSFEEYLKAKEESIMQEERLDDERRIYRRGYRKGVSKGREEGNKKGFIAGAVLTILMCGMIAFGGHALGNAYGNLTATNKSVDYGYSAVAAGTHRASDPQYYWYDYGDIALEFDANNMDFDSFVYGTFKNIGWNEESTLECMDRLFYQFNLYGFTNYDSFVSYCESKGVCEEKDGKVVINVDKYRDAVKNYIQVLNEAEKDEEIVEGFRQGK